MKKPYCAICGTTIDYIEYDGTPRTIKLYPCEHGLSAETAKIAVELLPGRPEDHPLTVALDNYLKDKNLR